jgi:polyisoprenoid-binding protein YceI
MNKILISAALLSALVYGGNLKFQSGYIKAHTSVFGDSTIDPTFHSANSRLTMGKTIDTLKGTIEVSMKNFASDNKDRDNHMQEALDSSSFPKATYNISSVTENGGDKYTLNGTLSLHGVSKPLSFDGTITNADKTVHIKARSKINMTDYGIKQPKMVLLTVRNQVDLSVDILVK